ncbi:3-deoxy-D-manno-octulosonic-acid transferase [Bibersteinia trehalosi USDA-ARS-USMARC-190]|uniref:3-deoxy-D-manno-octulosonic acid transferase n=1 Tax=Bibersteinia trehalosi USDA-ARS-USMARC-190 TaxID=1263832 RepID=W0R7W3_BIBTR|nr:lipid IV(A) 3-deoxy-D-manno-octulosonic acid transferase [Bibersteinia trehalosi]AHG86866.1 3-deoxy-D-manno-octulosonic-acid transferase [Bibersteinia trehalosi USDA-ARS-USMARC-190]
MLRFFYTVLIHLIQPLLLLMMYKRSLKQPEYRQRLSERYGIYNDLVQPKPQGIVIHAASVGEVIAATPLIKHLQKNYPRLPITVTTVTPTGSARVKAAFGDRVSHFYLPYDLPFAIRRFIRFVQPKLFIVIETELWPNLIRQMRLSKIPFIIANARLSPRSAKRYGWIRSSVENMLAEIELILAQDSVSAERYISLGFPAERLINTGNLKYDLVINDKQRQKVRDTAIKLNITHRPVWIAASTHEGEERIILEAHIKLLKKYPDLLLILVPRHPERFDSVELLVQKMNLAYIKRSSHLPIMGNTPVLLGDTMGEMMILYGLAQIAFVGGSLVKHGGHNPLEPIAFELPVISGQHTFNFPEVFSKLREMNGVIEIQSNCDSLVEAVDYLLEHHENGKKISQAGFAVLQENQGALQRHLDLLAKYIEN